MLQGWVIVVTSFAYLGLLFAIAYYADSRADAGRSIIANPYIYALSLAVYATAWTFYGSVGRAASDGVGFLPIYIGPTLMIALWWVVMRKILRISKENRITSLADFIASRYGKSALLGGVVTVIAVFGIVPYISLQLKAVSNSFTIVLQYPEIIMPTKVGTIPILEDTALWVALILALFTILFGTRHLYSAEHHEGMVAAIAFESLVKLLAFIAVGVFVTFGIYDGFGDVFARAATDARDHVPAAPVPGVGDRERQREAPQQGDLAVSVVHAGDKRVRSADRLRRAAALPGRHG
jgi:Na+/proline symporter